MSPVCRCGAMRIPLDKQDCLRDRGEKAERHERFVEGIFLVVSAVTSHPGRGAEHVVGHLDVRVAQILRGLAPGRGS